VALQEEMELQGQFLFKHRGILPLIILVIGMYVYISEQVSYDESRMMMTQNWYEYVCLLVSLFGLAFRIYVVGHAHSRTSGRNTKGQVADNVNTTGIYSMMRHPLYTGNFIMWLGVALLTQNIWFIVAFIAAYIVYYERIMFAEEQFLRRKFTDKYLQWASQTPAFFPSFKRYKSAELDFSVFKVLIQEKNGLLAVFVIFFVFQQAAVYFRDGNFDIRDPFIAGGLAVSVVYYLTIKILQKTTKIAKRAR